MKPTNVVSRYVPGSCNIGPAEVKRRYRIGFTGLALMILFILLVRWLKLSTFFKLGLFIPAFYSVSGFLQAFGRFCFVYGWKGLVSIKGKRKFEKITDDVYLKKDRDLALRYVIIVSLSSGVLTLLYILLPV